jgi:hypothetical protein
MSSPPGARLAARACSGTWSSEGSGNELGGAAPRGGRRAGDCGVRRGTASLSAWPGRSATDRPPRMPLVSPFKNGHAPKADLIAAAHGGRQSGSRGPGSGRARRARMAAVEICCSPSTRQGETGGSSPPGTCAGWPRLSRIRCAWLAWSGQAPPGSRAAGNGTVCHINQTDKLP